MAITQVGNRVYSRITDLSEEATLNNGDKLIFHCASTGNASLIDWSSVKIDLGHTTFESTFNAMLNFTSTASAWVDTMTESFNELEEKCDNAIDKVNSLTNDIDAIKMLIKLILGIATKRHDGQDNYRPDEFVASLSEEAKEIYDALIDEVAGQSGERPVFERWNLYYLSGESISVGEEG